MLDKLRDARGKSDSNIGFFAAISHVPDYQESNPTFVLDCPFNILRL
jgi:hypothetical protein